MEHNEVYSVKVKAGRRTYIFDVRQTQDRDYYVTISERRRDGSGAVYKQKIFVYKEDFNKFVKGLIEAVNHVKTELMPDYDYGRFDNSPIYIRKDGQEETID